MNETLAAGFQTLSDLEESAKARTAPETWAYVAGGSGEEITVDDNHAAFRRWRLRPRPLAGIRSVDVRTAFLGQEMASPIFVAPTAYQGLLHESGELATAKAASGARTLAMFSTLSSFSLEEIAAAAPVGPRWFQLYLQPEFAHTRELVTRAERAGYSAIVLTVDAPVLGARDRQTRDGVAIRSPVPVGNGPHVVAPARVPKFVGGVFEFPPDAAASWDILARVAETTRLPVVVKGILRADDAIRAVEAGARGIVVSNHGGRQLDRAVASLEALPEVVAAVGTRAEVYVDGGVRRGSDVLTALALGAKGVGIGRPVLWALAVGGEPGVSRLLTLLTTELASTMILAGIRSLPEIGGDLLRPQSA